MTQARIEDLIVKTLHVYDHLASTNYNDVDPRLEYAKIVSEQILKIIEQEKNERKKKN